MAQGSGQGTKEHLVNLKILLAEERNSDKLSIALGNAFVHVMEEMEKREKRQEDIDNVLFGNEKLKIKGLINDIRPLLLFYRRAITISAAFLAAFGLHKTGAWEWLKEKLF